MAFVTSLLVVRRSQAVPAESQPGLANRRRPYLVNHVPHGKVHVKRSLRMRMDAEGEDLPTFRMKNEASHNAWVEGYKSYLATNGEKACQMAMEGYVKLGRGAVFVVDRPDIASMYVSLGELERRDSTTHEEIEPIVARMKLYDPAKQFVVVYEIRNSSGGMQGADIVTPKRMPTRSLG